MKNWKIALVLAFILLGSLSFVLNSKVTSQIDLIRSPLSSNPAVTRPSSPTPTSVPQVTLGLMGDLGLGRHITSTARNKNDFSWSFQGVSSWLLENDLNLANLESPIIADCPTGQTGTFIFCGDVRFLPFLKSYKFIFNLANNHIFNYGQTGFLETKSKLNENSTPYFYSHSQNTEYISQTINGITFGFLGYDFITNPNLDTEQVINTVKKYDSQADWLIVSLHWGNEYLPQAENWRLRLGRQLVDAGADIVHGHHPHVWQPPEIYQNKPIFYSFGNFIFDQSWSYETSHTNIVRLTLTKDKIVQRDTFPVEIKYNSQPWIILPTFIEKN